MKRILFLSLAMAFYGSVNAQFWTQNFSSSNTVSDYVNVTPNSGQFDGISPDAVGNLTTSINSSALRFERTAANSIYAYRNFSFSTNPKFVQFKMDFEASSNSAGTQTPIFSVYIGSSFTSASTGSTSAYASRFGILAQATAGNFKIGTVDNIGGAPQSAEFSGKQTITFIVNNSGSDQTYTAPDASTESVANGKMDVWIGSTRGINDFSLKNTTGTLADISGFKIQATSQSGLGVYDFDNIEMTDLTGNITLSTSKFENSEANVTASPNPTQGVFELNNFPLTLEKINLTIYGLDSKLIETKTYKVSNGAVKLDISNLSKGIYFIKGDATSPFATKIVKE